MRTLSFSICLLALFLMIGCGKDSTTTSTTSPGSSPHTSSGVVPNDFLAGNNYDKLIVEIQYVTGNAPSATTVNNLTTFLQSRLNKPSGISVVQTSLTSPGKASFSLADIQAIESASRTQQTSGKTLTAYVFFADGDYASNSGNSKVLGIAYGSTSMVIFEKSIKEFSGGITQPPVSTLETTVLEHEFGHILGLVSNGTAMQTAHQDQPHGAHCSNTNCLMYYNVETSDVIGNIVGGNVPGLDVNCLNDVKANGGK